MAGTRERRGEAMAGIWKNLFGRLRPRPSLFEGGRPEVDLPYARAREGGVSDALLLLVRKDACPVQNVGDVRRVLEVLVGAPVPLKEVGDLRVVAVENDRGIPTSYSSVRPFPPWSCTASFTTSKPSWVHIVFAASEYSMRGGTMLKR